LQIATACLGGIFQKFMTRAALTLSMAVQRLKQLLESSPKSAENEASNSMRLGSVSRAEL
jgi:hypothetical protein